VYVWGSMDNTIEPTGTDHQWTRILRRSGLSLLQYSYIISAYHDQYHRDLPYLSRGIWTHKHIDGTVYLDTSEYTSLCNELSTNLTPEYLTFFHLKCQDEADRLLRTAAEIRDNSPYTEHSESQLAVLFSAYSGAAIRVMTFLTITVLLETVLNSHLISRVKTYSHKFPTGTTSEDLLSTLLFPRAKGLPSLALLDLYRLAEEAMQTTDIPQVITADAETAATEQRLAAGFPLYHKKLREYLARYDFITMEYYLGRPMSFAELLSQIRDLLPTAGSRLAVFERDQSSADREFDELTRRIEMDPQDSLMHSKAHDIHYQRQYRSDALFKAGRDVYDLLSHIGSASDSGMMPYCA
jgi:hypothetical protein